TRVFLWRGRSLPGPTSRVDDWRDKRIAGVEPDSVRAFEIARGKERYALERRDRRWTIAGRGPADSAAVTRLLEQYRRVAAVGFATPPQADSLRARRPSRQATLRGTSGGVLFVKIDENVRGRDVFIIQPTNPPAENLVELLLMVDAARRASAARITAVLPYFGYARQDRKDQPRVAISAKLMANLITHAGADRVLGMDFHSHQVQGF